MDEDQYILRLPPPLVERMRFALASNRRKDAAGDDKKAPTFSVNFTDERTATFTVSEKETVVETVYPASLVDLPAICETHKTADKRTYYKSGDVHQMLVVRMPDDPPPSSTVSMDGLTPAARNAGRRLAEPDKTFPAALSSSIEQRIKYVIDHKIKFRQKVDRKVEEDIVIEEETTVTAGDNKTAANPPAQPEPPTDANTDGITTQPATPAAVATPIDAAVLAPVMPSPLPDAATPMELQPSPSPAPMDTPVPADTPMPDADDDDNEEEEEEEDDDDDDDDDDLSDMAGELMKDEEEETRKRIERSNIDIKIKDKRQEIADLEERANAAPNPVLKRRILAKREGLDEELQKLQQGRQALDE